jgi:hypothetical protein
MWVHLLIYSSFNKHSLETCFIPVSGLDVLGWQRWQHWHSCSWGANGAQGSSQCHSQIGHCPASLIRKQWNIITKFPLIGSFCSLLFFPKTAQFFCILLFSPYRKVFFLLPSLLFSSPPSSEETCSYLSSRYHQHHIRLKSYHNHW